MAPRVMNRTDLQQLSDMRLHEANILLASGAYDGAYHLAGYAVECALKACIAKQFKEHDFPDKKVVNDSHTHDLEKLLALSGLKTAHQIEKKNNLQFAANWALLDDWSVETRYEIGKDKTKATDIVNAVNDPQTGVLIWLKKHW
jgi:HEPN domain-containing protein